MSKTIMLAKTLNPKAVKEGPYFLSEKLDGMPVVIYGPSHGDKAFTAWTRQGKEVTSIPHIIEELKTTQFFTRHIECYGKSDVVVGELYIEGAAQKDIRGLAVRQSETCEDLKLYVFPPFLVDNGLKHVRNVPHMVVSGADLMKDPEEFFIHKLIGNPVEGFIAYKVGEPWVAGKRSPQYMKILKEHTVDLLVQEMVEAVSKEGKPLGRVGAFICMWGDGTTKVGAGKLTHKEATHLWALRDNPQQFIIEVKYKKDPSYNKLREPTYQQRRTDKYEFDVDFNTTGKLWSK